MYFSAYTAREIRVCHGAARYICANQMTEMTECMCCCALVSAVVVCANGHAVCTACRHKMNRQTCLYCTPLQDTKEEVVAVVSRRRRRPAQMQPWRCTCIRECAWCALRAAACFFVTVYAGKVGVWLYVVTQDRKVSWLAWDKFWKTPLELCIGVLVLLCLAGCCIRR